MRHLFAHAAVAVALLFSVPALADMSQGDGARMPMADGSARNYFSPVPGPRFPVPATAPRKAAPAPAVNPWKHDFAPYGASGALPTGTAGVYPVPGAATAAQLDAQRRQFERDRANAYWGCYGDVRPVECAFPTSHNGGSTGGSD